MIAYSEIARLGTTYRVVVINDASQEPEIVALLAALTDHPSIVVLTNKINLGFVASVNRALAETNAGDVILLNADTLVPSGFVERLQRAAYLSDDIGTVIPLSNNSEISDFPKPNTKNPIGEFEDVRRIDRAASNSNLDVVVDVPNGTGFCLYISGGVLGCRRPHLEIFQRGYLEDIDFCLRARERGFRNVCAPSVYVGHAGTRSFKTEKRSLVRNLSVLDRRFPIFRTESAASIAARSTSVPARSDRTQSGSK